MADVRTVFRGLWVLAAISVVILVAASRRSDRAGTWRAVRGGAIGLTIGVVVVGVVGLVAFDRLFELFHEVFFPAGSYLFDPATDRLVQLFPFQFWDETAMVVGIVDHRGITGRGRRGWETGATIRDDATRHGAGDRARARNMTSPTTAGLLSVEAARDAVLAVAEPVGTERIQTADALGRVTAETVTASVSLPPWANSAMDGYAIRAADTLAASEDAPVQLEVVGDIAAGASPDVTVTPGSAARIATGAKLPPGADAVVPVEATTPLDAAGSTRAARARCHRAAAGRLPRPRTSRARAARSAPPAAT